MKSTTSDGRKIMDAPTAVRRNATPVTKNMTLLSCSVEGCNVEVLVHKKHFASLSNCGKEGCPNGRQS